MLWTLLDNIVLLPLRIYVLHKKSEFNRAKLSELPHFQELVNSCFNIPDDWYNFYERFRYDFLYFLLYFLDDLLLNSFFSLQSCFVVSFHKLFVWTKVNFDSVRLINADFVIGLFVYFSGQFINNQRLQLHIKPRIVRLIDIYVLFRVAHFVGSNW
jgi:hypothetical protein